MIQLKFPFTAKYRPKDPFSIWGNDLKNFASEKAGRAERKRAFPNSRLAKKGGL